MEILSAGIVKEILFKDEKEREDFKSTLPKQHVILGEGTLKRVKDIEFYPFILVEIPYKDYEFCKEIQEIDG